MAARKGAVLAAVWPLFRSEPFPLVRGGGASERPGAVKGAPLLGAAERTLNGEDRSEMIAEEGKAGEQLAKSGPPRWPPRTATDDLLSRRAGRTRWHGSCTVKNLRKPSCDRQKRTS